MAIVVVSKRHGGSVNGGCPEVVVWLLRAPDSLLSRWDGSTEGGGRRLHPYERGRGTRRLVLVVRKRS